EFLGGTEKTSRTDLRDSIRIAKRAGDKYGKRGKRNTVPAERRRTCWSRNRDRKNRANPRPEACFDACPAGRINFDLAARAQTNRRDSGVRASCGCWVYLFQ